MSMVNLLILDSAKITLTIALLKNTCGLWFGKIMELLEHSDDGIRQASANALFKLAADGKYMIYCSDYISDLKSSPISD